ncbi:MAG: hypothetical protein AAF226_17745 [Verrucomicrobiota bacterium]
MSRVIGSPIPEHLKERGEEISRIMDIAVKKAIAENERLGLSDPKDWVLEDPKATEAETSEK